MKLFQLLEGRDADLYHGYAKPEFASLAIKNNELAATTAQRFWADGKRRKEDDPEYKNSYWMKGVSTTRDFKFAKSWGVVVFSLDQSKINHNYKIIPFNWEYSMVSRKSHKREREEFVVKKSTMDNYFDSIDDHNPEKKQFNFNRFGSAEGSIKPLNKFLNGIWMDEFLEKNVSYWNESKESLDLLKNHPLFKGYYK
jgi:hypothetical protein